MFARSIRLGRILVLGLSSILASAQARANIYQWAWVNPGDPSQGVMQSTTLCPSGSGVDAAPSANLSLLDLTQAYLINADLTTASLYGTTLTNANMTGATIVGTQFGSTNLTAGQLYSTASYQAGNLQGIGLDSNNLAGWNLAGQNLAGAVLYTSTLTSANLAGANLTYADLFYANLTGANLQNAQLPQATLTGANLTATDLRGTISFDGNGTNMTNAIRPDGTIQGLNVNASNPSLVIRDVQSPLPAIQVADGMTVASGGTLQLVFDGPTWGSKISFNSGSSVALGGNLDLQIAPGVDLTGLLGKDLRLFDWTGAAPVGQFGQIGNNLPSGYAWNTSSLYTLGTIDLTLTTGLTGSGAWATNGGGSWSGSANWTGGFVPGRPQDTAVFGDVLTGGTANVSLDTAVALASLSFNTSGGASYVISGSSTNALVLSNTAGQVTISNNGGSHTIAAPISLQSSLSVSASPGTTLVLAGDLAESGTACGLTLSGGGQLVLAGSSNYSGGTEVVNGGRLIVLSPQGLKDGSDLFVGSTPSALASMPVDTATSFAGGGVTFLTPVPEPGTATFAIVASVILLGYRWRRIRFSP